MTQSTEQTTWQALKKQRQKRARTMFEQPAPAGYLEEWAKYLALSCFDRDAYGKGVILFDLGDETLAWPAADVQVTLNSRPVHVLPNQRSRVLLGVAHVRGALLPCMSLAALLGLQKKSDKQQPMLMVGDPVQPWLFGVQKFSGFYRYQDKNLIDMPYASDDKQGCFSQGVFEYKGKSVALLDPVLVLSGFGREM